LKTTNTRRTALTAVFAAISVVLLFLGSVSVIGDMALCAVAGYVTAAGVLTNGKRYALAQFCVTGLLALLLLPSKFAAALYIAFPGWYPVLKSFLERKIRSLPALWLIKLALFNLVIQIYIYAVKMFALAPEVQNSDGFTAPLWLFVIAANFVCVLYDYSIYSASALYMRMKKR
jgi:hypothetical protein